MFIEVKDLKCPMCGAEEMHPDGDKILIRGFKVQLRDGHWWSQCLVCSGYYDLFTLEVTKENHDGEKGWF